MSATTGVAAGGYKTVMSRMSIDWRILEVTARNTKGVEMKMSAPYGVLSLNVTCDRAVQQKAIGSTVGNSLLQQSHQQRWQSGYRVGLKP